MALTTAQGSAAYLNRAFNAANASTSAFAAQAADLTAGEIAAANKFDVPALTDAALAKQVLTNMGLLPTTNSGIAALEPALADYFATAGKGNRGFVVLQLSRILADKVGDATYGAAAAAWNATVADSVVSSGGALTSSATDNIVGSSSDDIFSAISASLSTANTLSATDKLDGGAGNDVLNVSLSKANSAMTTGYIKNVETVNLTNTSEQALTFDATKVTGVTTYTVNGATASTNITNAETGLTTVNLNSIKNNGGVAAATSFTLSYGSAASEVTGTADALAINLSSVGASSTNKATVTINSIETANINLTGTNYAALAGDSLKKIVVTGSGSNTKFGTLGSTVTSFDASAATGNITVDLSSAGTLTKVATGAGTDTVTYDVAKGSAIATLSGGAGADTLNLKNSTSATTQYTMTGFETLALTSVTGALTMSNAKSTDLTTVTSDSTTTAAVTLVDMGAGALTVTATGATDNGGTISSDHTGSTTVNYVAELGTASVASDLPTADYVFSKSTGTLTVSNGAYVSNQGSTIQSDASTAVVLNIDSGMDTAGTTEKTIFNSSIQADKATTLNVNATGQLGSSAAFRGNALTTATIVNGVSSGNFTFTTGSTANKVSSLDITSGAAFTLTAGATNAAAGSATAMDKVETLKIAANKGLTTVSDFAKASSVTLSGTGTTSQINIGNLGAANATDLTVTATGLKAGLSSNSGNTAGPTLDVGLGFDINANFDATTGTVFLGAVGGLSSNTPDDVTISAKKATGAFTVGNVKGTGDVSVIASGSTSASKVGTVTGDNVTVDVSSTGAGSYIGDITATTSATVTYSAIERTNYAATSAGSSGKITGSSTSTALAVKVTSGILADEIIINGGAKQTSITVTGDTGASSDNVIVTATATTATSQTISLAGLTGYETSTITTGAKKDTIVGGAGADTITGGAGQDTLTGGAGADVFKFNNGDSTYLAPDTITDLGATDEIWSGTGTVALVVTSDGTDAVAAVAGSKAKINTFGVASFNSETTAPATLSAAATLVEASVYGNSATAGKAALFAFGGDTYMFVSDGTSGLATTDLVIKLTGVALPNAALVDNGTASTGLSGLGS